MYANDNTGSLHAAVKAGNLQDVMDMLEKGVDVDAADCLQVRPLHIAAEQGHLDILKALIKRGCNVNAQASCPTTPMEQKQEMEEFLAPLHSVENRKRHALPLAFMATYYATSVTNAGTSSGMSPLHLAVKRGDLSIVQALVYANADVNVETNLKVTPLYCAVAQNCEDVAEFLVQNGAVVNAASIIDSTPLHFAAAKGNVNITKLLVQNEAVVNATNSDGSTPLHYAADYWHVEVVKYLLAKGADVNVSDHLKWTPLHFAASTGSTAQNTSGPQALDSKLNTMKALIENGADINAKGMNKETPLITAVKSGDAVPVAAVCLLENGAYYDSMCLSIVGEVTASQIAAIRGYQNVNALLCATEKLFKSVRNAKCVEIEKRIQEGAPVNSRSIKYGTPLMYASWKGHLAVVNVLLKNGASIDLSNSNGITPLHYAAKFGHKEILCVLLQHGAVYNARTKTGKKTPLNFAQEGGKIEVIETLKLIERIFIRINIKDNTVVKELNDLKSIKYAEFLAVKNCKNVNRETITQIALKNGCEELCRSFGDL